jgi:hypothetical protein
MTLYTIIILSDDDESNHLKSFTSYMDAFHYANNVMKYDRFEIIESKVKSDY